MHQVMEVFYRPELASMRTSRPTTSLDIQGRAARSTRPCHEATGSSWISAGGSNARADRTGAKKADQTRPVPADGRIRLGHDHGGIFYFHGPQGLPAAPTGVGPETVVVHIETLISLLKGYELTGDRRCLEWFKRVTPTHGSMEHFRDLEYPEWFGYLNRRGEVLLDLKGMAMEGCFHVPAGSTNAGRPNGSTARQP